MQVPCESSSCKPAISQASNPLIQLAQLTNANCLKGLAVNVQQHVICAAIPIHGELAINNKQCTTQLVAAAHFAILWEPCCLSGMVRRDISNDQVYENSMC
jgi:hypothetical protein